MCAPTSEDHHAAETHRPKHSTVAALESDAQVLRQVEQSQGSNGVSSQLKGGLGSVQAHTSTESGLSGPMVPARFTIIDDYDGDGVPDDERDPDTLLEVGLDPMETSVDTESDSSKHSLVDQSGPLASRRRQPRRRSSLGFAVAEDDVSDDATSVSDASSFDRGPSGNNAWSDQFSTLQTHIRARKLATAVTGKPQISRAPLLSRSRSKQVMRMSITMASAARPAGSMHSG